MAVSGPSRLTTLYCSVVSSAVAGVIDGPRCRVEQPMGVNDTILPLFLEPLDLGPDDYAQVRFSGRTWNTA